MLPVSIVQAMTCTSRKNCENNASYRYGQDTNGQMWENITKVSKFRERKLYRLKQ